MASAPPRKSLVFAALITVQILFGINYAVSKAVVGHFPPLVWASLRLIVSSLIMLLFAFLSRRKHPELKASFFVPLIGLALLGTIINQASFLVGLRYTTSTNSAILNTLIPIFTLLVVTLRGLEPLTRNKFFGFIFAFAGVMVIRKVENFSLSDQTVMGDLLTILNCFSYALFLSYGRKFIQSHDPIWTTTWLFIYGSIGLTILALPSYQTFTWPAVDFELGWQMAFAILGATFLTYFLNFWALAHAKASHVAIFIYLQPIVASALAWAWWGESVTPRTVGACALIFVGVLVTLIPVQKKTKSLAKEFAA